jgi:hypothetical protein
MLESFSAYRLTFEYNFVEENDLVFFAYSIPYTYSELISDIDKMPNKLVKKYTLARTHSGVDIPVLHISNHEYF